MESNNRKADPDQPPIKMEVGDWRSKLTPESREKVIKKIMETLKKYQPYPAQLPELYNMAAKFEEKIYSVAASQSDYLRRISMKLLAMDNKAQSASTGSLAASSASGSRNRMESVPKNMQVQRNNHGQAVMMPSEAIQPEILQQMLAPDLPRNIASTGIQSSAGLASTLPPVSGRYQSPMSNLMNSSNMQDTADASQNGTVNTMEKGVANSVFNTRKELPGRQGATPGHQQFQQQQPQQLIKQKQLQQGIIPDSLTQSPIRQQQQQHLLQPNQTQSLQQAGNSTSNAVLQQHPHNGLRKQQNPQQTPSRHQQQVAHQSTRSSQPQQQLQTSQPLQSVMGHRTSTTNMQPAQLLGQQNMSEMPQHHQRLIGQQNSISNLQQEQQLIAPKHMGHQGNISRLQQQLHGTRSSSDMQHNQHQTHLVHQNRGPVPQQNQQAVTSLLANHGHHSQPHIMSQIKSESAQMQQHLGMNPRQQRDVHQRLQPSGSLMQSHNIGDQQKQMFQSASADSVSQTGHASSANWQEEIHNKITSLKRIYFDDLRILYLKVSRKLEQLHSLPQQSNEYQLEKLSAFKLKLKGLLTYLLVEKSNVTPAHGENMRNYEKLVVTWLNAHRPRRPEHDTPPIHQIQSRENHLNPSPQSDNIHGPVMMEQNNTSGQHNSVSSLSGVANAQVNMIGVLKPEPNVDAGQGSRLASLQQGIDGSLQQNSVNAPQQTNMNALSMRNDGSLVQSNISTLQSMSNVNQQLVKEQHTMQSQHFKHQYQQQQQQQQRHQQMIQNQQQSHQQSKHQQQAGLLSAHQLPQLQQMAKMNDVNLRQGFGVKPGDFSQHHTPTAGQHSAYHQLKSGVSFPMSSLQMLQAPSPRILQNSSPQVDQQNMLTSSKAGTPLPSANSPFIVPSPSTPLAASPLQGDSEKLASNVSPITTTGNIRVQQSAPTQLVAIETSGISASPLLAEVSNQDGATSASATKSSITEEPLDRIIRAVKSISNEALTASVNDIVSVVSLIDRIAGSPPGNGSRAAVGVDLAAMTKSQLQAKNLVILDKGNGSKKMKRCTSSLPLVVVATNGSWEDNFTQLFGSELSDLESTATPRAKRPRIEVNHSLLKEIRDINQRLIDTMVDISEEDDNPCRAAEVASEGGEGVIVKCSYNAVALSPDLKCQYATPQLSPIQPLRLLVPSNYPNCSPVLLDKPPVNISDENEDLSMKAKSKLSQSLRTLAQPISLKEIARAWDVCARAVISEYAQAIGGGSFSSTYGSWESVF